MKRSIDRKEFPERLQYTKYYEHDGMLRACANRAMVMAFVFAGIAVTSLQDLTADGPILNFRNDGLNQPSLRRLGGRGGLKAARLEDAEVLLAVGLYPQWPS